MTTPAHTCNALDTHTYGARNRACTICGKRFVAEEPPTTARTAHTHDDGVPAKMRVVGQCGHTTRRTVRLLYEVVSDEERQTTVAYTLTPALAHLLASAPSMRARLEALEAENAKLRSATRVRAISSTRAMTPPLAESRYAGVAGFRAVVTLPAMPFMYVNGVFSVSVCVRR